MPETTVLDIQEYQEGSGVFIARLKPGISKLVSEKVIGQFGDELTTFAQLAPPKADLIVDLGPLQYLSSLTFGRLVKTKYLLRANGGTLHIADVKPDLMEVVANTGLDTLINMHPKERAVDLANSLLPDGQAATKGRMNDLDEENLKIFPMRSVGDIVMGQGRVPDAAEVPAPRASTPLNDDDKALVEFHVQSFMDALDLHTAFNAAATAEHSEAFQAAERQVENAVREAFSSRRVVDALTALEDLIDRTQIDASITASRSSVDDAPATTTVAKEPRKINLSKLPL